MDGLDFQIKLISAILTVNLGVPHIRPLYLSERNNNEALEIRIVTRKDGLVT